MKTNKLLLRNKKNFSSVSSFKLPNSDFNAINFRLVFYELFNSAKHFRNAFNR